MNEVLEEEQNKDKTPECPPALEEEVVIDGFNAENGVGYNTIPPILLEAHNPQFCELYSRYLTGCTLNPSTLAARPSLVLITGWSKYTN